MWPLAADMGSCGVSALVCHSGTGVFDVKVGQKEISMFEDYPTTYVRHVRVNGESMFSFELTTDELYMMGPELVPDLVKLTLWGGTVRIA